jgi:hypothetical protein
MIFMADKMAEKKRAAAKFGIGKAVGVLLMLFGIVIAIYFAYIWASLGARVGGAFVRSANGIGTGRAFNGTAFNASRFNSTRALAAGRFAGAGISPLAAYFEGIAIGALMLLLGIMTFKYSDLKSMAPTKK